MKESYRGISAAIGICFAIWISFFFLSTEKTSAAIGDTVILNDEAEEISIAAHLQILKDTKGTLEVHELLQPPHNWKFVSTENGIPSGGVTPAVYWLRFTVNNQTNEKQWLLELTDLSIDKATLYSLEDSGTVSEGLLENTVASSREADLYQNTVFELLPMKEGDTTFFLRVQSQGMMDLSLTIWENEAFEAQSRQTSAAFGLLSGLGLLFFGCCVKWFFKYRNPAFFHLFLLGLSTVAVFSIGTGISWTVLWPELGWWNRRVIGMFLGIASISILFITKGLMEEVLPLKWLSTVIKIVAIVVVIAIVCSYFSYQIPSLFLAFFIILSAVLSFIISVHAGRKGHTYAMPYALAMFLVMVASLLLVFIAAAFLPYKQNVEYALYLTSGISLLFIAKALLSKEKVTIERSKQIEKQAKEHQLLEIEMLKNANKRKDELLAFTSHSLQTPLSRMVGIVESLQESADGKLPPSMANQLSDLAASGKNMSHLVNEILDSSKLKQPPLASHGESIAMHELCNSVLALCRPLLQKKPVKLHHTVPNSLPNVLADPERVKQILYNLVDNSIQHTHDGEILVSAHIKGDQLEILVKDTGVGIQVERIPSLFEWDMPLEHHGIGLRITKNLVELQGGTLKVDSKLGHGSTFSFTLPIQMDQQTAEFPYSFDSEIEELTASKLADSIIKHRPIKQSLHILVIESEEINRSFLLHQLTSEGYQVLGAADGKEALELLLHKPVELVVMDGYLTDMSGDDLCRRIRLDFTLTELPILMLSNVDSLQNKKEAFTAGANDFLLKPCDKEEFLMRIETLANMRSLTQEITNMNYFLERNVKERTMALEITNMNLLTVNDEIQEVEKSRNDMLSAISHELGTPITLIHSYIQAVKESLIEENNPKYLDMIHKKLMLLERLTEDLVELTKYKSGNMTLRFEERELHGWLKRLVDSMASDVQQSGRSFEFLGTQDPDEMTRLYLAIDLDRLDQVVSNILWNAVKHTSVEGGKVTLSMEILANNNKEASLGGEADGELVIRIADNGCGIKKEALPHIFERFYKIDSSAAYKGSGLGLTIAKEIILAHKGQIWAESTEGKGSVFIIVLPLTFH